MPEKKVDLLPIIGWDIGADPSGSIGLMTIRSLPGFRDLRRRKRRSTKRPNLVNTECTPSNVKNLVGIYSN
jgi:hypothetical protein